MKLSSMRHWAAITAAAVLALAGLAAGRAEAAPPFNNFTFEMVPSASTCVARAFAKVTVAPVDTISGLVENMHIEAYKLPKNTNFALFVIQQPVKPFGLSWYMGDIFTDGNGSAVGDFVGRFSIGTFIVAPGSTTAPKVLPDDATTNPPTPPVQLYHLGLWFDSPLDANRAGCGNKSTPFNSIHNAGVQALNTNNFKANFGPLRFVVDR